MNTAHFLTTLFDGRTGFFEVRPLGVGRAPQSFIPIEDMLAELDELPRIADNLKERGLNFYFGVLPRDLPRGTKDAVSEGDVLWADIDFKHSDEATCRAKLAAFEPQPSITVATGGGLHCYWLLDRLHPADELEHRNKGIEQALDSDSVSNADRILRMPGSYNVKYDPPRLVVIEHMDEDRVFELEQFPYAKVIPKPEQTTCTYDEDRRVKGIQLARFAKPKGQRSEARFSLACRLVRDEHDDDTIFHTLVYFMTEVLPEPYDIDEASRKARHDVSNARVTVQEQAERTLADASHLTLAQALAEHNPTLIYDAALGVLSYEEEVGAWEVMDDVAQDGLVHTLAGTLVPGRQGPRPLTLNRKDVTGIKATLPSVLVTSHRVLGESAGIHFANGVLTEDGTLVPHSSGNFIVANQARDYPFDPTALPLVQSYLDSMFDGETKEYLLGWLGSTLFGKANHKQAMHPIILGRSECGKSVFLDLVSSLFPDEAVACQPYQRFDDTFGLQPLVGKALNLVDDMSADNFKRSGIFKSIATGGAVNVNVKNKPALTRVQLPVANICAVNELPTTSDKTEGFYRRYVVVPLTQRFQGSDRRPELEGELRAARSSLAKLAHDAYLRLKANRMMPTEPEVSRIRKGLWRTDNDIVALYIAEHLRVVSPELVKNIPLSARITKASLYEAIRMKALSHGLRAVPSPGTIRARLEENDINPVRVTENGTKRRYVNVVLVNKDGSNLNIQQHSGLVAL